MSCLIISDIRFYYEALSVKASLEPGQTSKIERFAKIVDYKTSLTIFVKRSILNV